MWTFCSPKVTFGEGALEALAELSGKRALVVTDRTLVALGLVDRVTACLAKAGIEAHVFDAVEPDPSVQTVLQGAEVAQEIRPDWIVGVGGGSPMDAAKAIWVLYERPDLVPAEIVPFITLGLRRKARLVTVPTTSGTGAEVTWAIVLTDARERRKMGLGNRENVADLAVVDPGVGTQRRALVAKARGQFWVGPDNGLLMPAAARLGGVALAVLAAEGGGTLHLPACTIDIFVPIFVPSHTALRGAGAGARGLADAGGGGFLIGSDVGDSAWLGGGMASRSLA